MATSGDYLDRLRNIREKYGCSQGKGQSTSYGDQYLGAERAGILERPSAYEKAGATYYKADLYSAEKNKLSEQTLVPPPSAALGARAH